MGERDIQKGKPPEKLTEDEQDRLAELCEKHLEAKQAEQGWKDKRKKIESEIVELVPTKGKGSKTTTYEGLGFKVKTTGRIYRSVDESAWEEIKDQIPEDLRPVIKWKAGVDERGLQHIRENEPEAWKKLQKVITSNPGAPGVKITPLDE